MNKWILLPGLLLFSSCYAAVYDSPEMAMTVDSSQSRFVISLPSNPTTGYSWTLKNYNSNLFKLLSSQFHPLKPKLIGSGGKTVFVFQVLKGVKLPVRSTFEFFYARPWEPENGRTQKVRVNFQKGLNTAAPVIGE
ncbi:secreted protein [Legionella birminghamensis]|uniref:Secreted protein n=1 Tax=Legionella birminghamensis TaxID=28083 RepID=A0A378I8G4_9GAMM|nr:protease inhibitor I42 family protein [Legionella birminghamensis]KTC74704.1 secreted protein [Legionella birminghamensis]STX31507.1 secreted protein [Legionella birminghamensis]